MKNSLVPSVNFHLWEPCNMRCKFCFATFQDVKKTILPKGHLPKDEAIQVIKELAAYGYEKITFAGGEPTLCSWLDELILTAKDSGMTTMIVTNGTKLDTVFLEKNKRNLDWITLSIDSLLSETNLEIGRSLAGRTAYSLNDYLEIIDNIKSFNYGLKINTVVNAENFTEDFSELIYHAQPKRWKILQVLPVLGQNERKVNRFLIKKQEFDDFVNRHLHLNKITELVPENNDQMTSSYAMIDPAGRFFDNTQGKYTYSQPILEIGVQKALKQVVIDKEKFLERGGLYDWDHDNK